ncbi:MAG: hypothetical protein KF745_14830 [Phycisphaeraceae bacterium]|nr:hypothetical protein [Phycisphaeraceae bacterium]
MSSSFKGKDLFGSGPHRFATEPIGSQLLPTIRLGAGPIPGTTWIGPLEEAVVVRGRLVAPTDAALQELIAAIAEELADPSSTGSLADHAGHEWKNMSFVLFTPADRTDRARLVSLAYTARFLKFLLPPPGGS